jgi:hypothetical protein
MGVHVASVRSIINICVGKLVWKIPLGRPRRRRNNNIKIYLAGKGRESLNCNNRAMAHERDRDRLVVKKVMNFRFALNLDNLFAS